MKILAKFPKSLHDISFDSYQKEYIMLHANVPLNLKLCSIKLGAKSRFVSCFAYKWLHG
jgi:hypothetical protein